MTIQPRTSIGRLLGWLLAALPALVSLILSLSLIARSNILWDEAVDLRISEGLLRNPFFGNELVLDATQTRLPMYATALAFALFGTHLRVARAASCLAGAAAVLLTTLAVGRWRRSRVQGFCAGMCMAVSPYWLSNCRLACTEGDVFAALGTAAVMFALARYWLVEPSASQASRSPRSPQWGVAAGGTNYGTALLAVSLALLAAIGAKVFGLVLLVTSLPLVVRGSLRHGPAANHKQGPGVPDASLIGPRPPQGPTERLSSSRKVMAWLSGSVLLLAASGPICALVLPRWAMLLLWLLLLAGWLTVVSLAWQVKRSPGRALTVLLVLAITLAGVAATMPQHFTRPDAAKALARRLLRWDGQSPAAQWQDNLVLHLGVIAIKPTPLLALFGVIGAVATVRGWRNDGYAGWLAATFAAYMAALLVLPLRQYFYLMSVWPIFAAWQGVALGSLLEHLWQMAGAGRPLALATGLLLIAYTSAELSTTWPDPNLYGYHLVGDRWLGRESRGYRNLIQTPCDGLAEAIRWCEANLPAGSTVQSYAWADHVFRELIPHDSKLRYLPRRAEQNRRVGPDISTADALILHINNFVEYHDAPSEQDIRRYFANKPAFVVRRAYNLPFVWVYTSRGATVPTH